MIWNFFKSGKKWPQEISADDAVALDYMKNCVFIDVREADEVAHGMIDGAKHLPLSQLGRGGKLPSLPHEAHVILYCNNTARARQAARLFTEQGIDYVYILKGGYKAWKEADAYQAA